ncbi:MAG: VOC family protein [Candidatus Udaeobacter sp.]
MRAEWTGVYRLEPRKLSGEFKFTEAVSFVINCDTKEEIDYYWEKLTAGGGKEVQCGWLADKYGLSWRVTPTKFFAEWVKDPPDCNG